MMVTDWWLTSLLIIKFTYLYAILYAMPGFGPRGIERGKTPALFHRLRARNRCQTGQKYWQP